MNRLDRFRYGSLHRRRVMTLLLTLVAVFLIAVIFLTSLGIFGVRSELVRIRISDERNGNICNGIGINLDYIPMVNRVRDASFEESRNYRMFSIADSEGDFIYMSPEEDSGYIPEAGSIVNVLSSDNTGAINQVFTGVVSGYREAGLGTLDEVIDSNSLWSGQTFSSTVLVEGKVVALTDAGNIYSDILSENMTASIGDDNNYVKIASHQNCLYALDDSGIMYYSADAGVLNPISEKNVPSENLTGAEILQVLGRTAVLCEDGLFVFSNNEFAEVDVPFEGSVADSSDELALFADSQGNVYITCNYIAYTEYPEICSDTPIDVIETRNNFYILCENGSIVYYDSSLDTFEEIEGWNITGKGDMPTVVNGVSAAPIGDGRIIAVTDAGLYLISGEGGTSTAVVSNMRNIEYVYESMGNRILCSSDSDVYSTRVLSGVQISDTVPENVIMEGDLCFVSTMGSPVNFISEEADWNLAPEGSYWDVYGEGTVAGISAIDYSPQGGKSCLKLTGISDNVHVLSQVLSGPSTDNFEADVFYRIELQLRAEGEVSPVQVWLEGERFNQVGFTVDNINDKFTSYSYVFAVTENMLSAEDSVSLNISFEGEGSLYVDNVYLGEDRYDVSSIPSEVRDYLVSAAPSAIRFNNLMIGRNGFNPSAFYSHSAISPAGETGTVSIEDALTVARDASASPWLVISSYASGSDIDSMIEYMCGSVSSEYGHMRIDNGTAIPWSRQFDTIYIEINDDYGCFTGDVLKGAYVNFIIKRIQRSEYYSEIRDKVVFIDGMNYDGGLVLSSANFHSSVPELEPAFEDIPEAGYAEIIDRNLSNLSVNAPRVSGHGADAGEFIASLDVNSIHDLSSLNSAQFFASLISSGFRMIMLDCNFSSVASDYSNMTADSISRLYSNLPFLKFSEGLYFEIAEPMDENSGQNVEAFSRDMRVSYFTDSQNNYLVIANVSGYQQQFVIEGIGIEIGNAHVRRFSAEGELINERRVRNITPRQTLQSGEYLIITIGE